MNIIFIKTAEISDGYEPKPASEFIPEWYKNMNSYINNEKKPAGNGQSSATIKRCMPVFDSITSGYVLFTHIDIYVSQKETLENDKIIKAPWYEWPSQEPIGFHPIYQAPNHPNRNGHEISYPKWINVWGIKTPPGYSTLFVQPFHRESVFNIMPGIVDTDKYNVPVNFPFVLNDVTYEGIIPAGTPLAQLIPFKRDNWKMSFGGEKELQEQNKTFITLKSKFFDVYKNNFRTLKEYK